MQNNRLETFIERMKGAKTLDELRVEILGLRNLYDVDHLVYHSVNRAGGQYAVLTYDDAWVDHYIEEDYLRIDPVVQGCLQRFDPVDWKRLDWSSKPAKSFLHEALDSGLGNQGFSVPIRGPQGQFALFTVNNTGNDDRWASYTQCHVRELILAAHYVNQKALEIENSGGDTDILTRVRLPNRAMSPRETDVLTLLALGYSRAQAAENLSISEHTLRSYLESARNKLGAMNTTHAVARALNQGLLVI